MKKLILGLALAGSAFAVPAQAAQVLPAAGFGGNPAATFDEFDATTRGTLLAYSETSGVADTFSATFKSAVYRNSNGTIDFYYQVVRTGAGPLDDNEISSFTAASFEGWDVFAFRDGSNFDGDGGFLAANNPGGFTSLARRSSDGKVVGANFLGTGLNGLTGTDTSTTYIFRTNAPSYTRGTFGVIDGSTLRGITFAPAVPEPATWAMMIGGFGMLGMAARRSRRLQAVYA